MTVDGRGQVHYSVVRYMCQYPRVGCLKQFAPLCQSRRPFHLTRSLLIGWWEFEGEVAVLRRLYPRSVFLYLRRTHQVIRYLLQVVLVKFDTSQDVALQALQHLGVVRRVTSQSTGNVLLGLFGGLIFLQARDGRVVGRGDLLVEESEIHTGLDVGEELRQVSDFIESCEE